MMEKTHIVEALGEAGLVLPNLVAAGLRANDRAKYYMSLLQACREHVARPDRAVPDLRAEREASGEDDTALDDLASACRPGLDDALFIPRAARIHGQLLGSVEQMLAPLRVASDLSQPLDRYEQRLTCLRDSLPPVSEETVPSGYVHAITSTDRAHTTACTCW